MKQKILFVIFVILFSNVLWANDSTALYKARIQKLRTFYEWLSKRPYQKVNIYEADTTSKAWSSYDTAISVFFDKGILDSLYENKGEKNDIFSKAAKFQMLKQSIAGFHDLSKHQCFDSLLFKSLDSSYIVQYFLVEKKEYEYSAFGFIANSSVLLELPIIGMGASEYKVFKTYYDNLKGCKK